MIHRVTLRQYTRSGSSLLQGHVLQGHTTLTFNEDTHRYIVCVLVRYVSSLDKISGTAEQLTEEQFGAFLP